MERRCPYYGTSFPSLLAVRSEHLYGILLNHYSSDNKIHPKPPPRLVELTHSYPYGPSEDTFLARPRFSTRTYDALYVQLDIKRKSGDKQRAYTLLDLVTRALSAEVADKVDATGNLIAFLRSVQEIANPKSGPLEENGHAETNGIVDTPPEATLNNVFADESVRLLQLHSSGEFVDVMTSSTSLITAELASFRSHRRSISLDEGTSSLKRADSIVTTKPQSLRRVGNQSSPISTGLGTDWASFSTSGFFDGQDGLGANLAATLLDNDVEVSKPKPAPPKKLSIRRKSAQVDTPADSPTTATNTKIAPPKPTDTITIVSTSLTTIDEAFIDFWSDAILDPISKQWPLFAVCQLKSPSSFKHEQKSVTWLVFEGSHSKEAPPPPPPEEIRRPASPTMSMRSLKGKMERPESRASKTNSTSSKPKKLFGIFSTRGRSAKHDEPTSPRRVASSTVGKRIGEMGEILPEEEPKKAGEPVRAQEPAKTVPTIVEPPTVPEKERKVEESERRGETRCSYTTN